MGTISIFRKRHMRIFAHPVQSVIAIALWASGTPFGVPRFRGKRHQRKQLECGAWPFSSATGILRQQSLIVALDGLVALASSLLELIHVEEANVAAAVYEPSRLLNTRRPVVFALIGGGAALLPKSCTKKRLHLAIENDRRR